MNSRDRLLTAINKGKPDRLPVTVHQWQPYHLNHFMGGISELAAFKRCGLDAQVQYFGEPSCCWKKTSDKKENTKHWSHTIKTARIEKDNTILDHIIKTPEGDLSFKTGFNEKTTWVTEHMIKNDDDIYLIDKYMPVPKLNIQEVNHLYNAVGDDGILRGIVWGEQAGCWQQAAVLMDITQLIYATFEKPDWVHEFLEILLEKKIQFIEGMKGAIFDLVETGGGSSSTTLISPDIHEEFCMPYDKKIHNALHDLGYKTTYHTCGGTMGIEEMIINNGTDASETLAPISVGGNQEPWDFKKKVGDNLALIGGVDQFRVLTSGDEKMIMETVQGLFEKVGYDGGYICSASDHFFDAPPENLIAFGKAARECIY